MEVQRCEECALVYLHPLMEKDEERRFYADYGKHLQDRGMIGGATAADLFETTKPEAMQRMNLVRPYVTSTMNLVEIGASAGAFCCAVNEHVHKVIGVEPSQEHAAHMASLGVTAVPYLDGLDPNEQFDAAAFFHVLEHMRRPVEFLQDVGKILKPQAYVFVEVPNVQDALLSLYNSQEFTDFYYQAMHCVYFSPDTLEGAFHRAGFSTVELVPKQRYDLSNHMVWLQKGKPGGMGHFSAVFNSELEANYESCLKEQWLCDTIFGIFRRG